MEVRTVSDLPQSGSDPSNPRPDLSEADKGNMHGWAL